MNSQLYVVMQRRGELLARIAAQREQVAEIGARLQTPLALVDLGVAAARFLRSYPVVIAGAIAALVIRRRSVVGMAEVIWRVWKGYCNFTVSTARLSSRRDN